MSTVEADTELFGPVAVVHRVESDDTALQLANGHGIRLGRQRIQYQRDGGQGIPFGGIKRSGFGRELGTLGIEELLNKRLT